MPRLKLSYFDFHGGRGESIRLALAIGNIPFEDHRFAVSEWPVLKEQTPLHQVPVLEIDGEAMTQSNALNRYVGKLAGLYPWDPLEAARCDEVMDAVEDIVAQVVVTFGIEDEDEKRAARQALVSGPISMYLKWLDGKLEHGGGRYFAQDRLTVADLKVFVWTRSLGSGVLDHVPKDVVEQTTPRLNRHLERISAHPGVSAYYQEHGKTR